MDMPRSSKKKLSRLQQGGIGFLMGALIFTILSLTAPIAQNELIPNLCSLAPGRHFPSGLCMLFSGLVGALWMGPASLLAIIPGIQFIIPSFLVIRIISGIMVALLAAIFFWKFGIRKGAAISLLVSGASLAIFTILFAMFAVWG